MSASDKNWSKNIKESPYPQIKRSSSSPELVKKESRQLNSCDRPVCSYNSPHDPKLSCIC